MRSVAVYLVGLVALSCGTAAPASQKPCRDQDGKIIVCVKAPPKEAPARCKDEKGRFVACKKPAPTADRH
jgi:hypothetical protein